MIDANSNDGEPALLSSFARWSNATATSVLLNGISLRRGARRSVRRHRALGRRQDDVLALPERAGGFSGGPDRRGRRQRCSRTSRRASAAQRLRARSPPRRHGVSAVQSVSASHGAGQRDRSADARAGDVARGKRSNEPPGCSIAWAWPTSWTTCPTCSPAGSSSAWRLPGHWR